MILEEAVAYLKPGLPDDGTPAINLLDESAPILRSYSSSLLVSYLVDQGNSYQYVQSRHLTESGMTEEDLHAIGIRNLASLARERDLRVVPYNGIFAVLMGGDFEASLLLVDHLWDHQFRAYVSGDCAAAIPARDILAFCDSGSLPGVHELEAVIARAASTADHPLSDMIHVRRDKLFIPRST